MVGVFLYMKGDWGLSASHHQKDYVNTFLINSLSIIVVFHIDVDTINVNVKCFGEPIGQ
jgi:hypothetical protein